MDDVEGRRFDGRVVVITGGSRGIGLALARRMHDEGASVVVTGRRQGALDEALSQIGPRSAAFAGDAVDPSHQHEVMSETASRFGRVDYLVSNAGLSNNHGPLVGLDSSAVEEMIDVNLLAPLSWARVAIDHGLARAIVNVASEAGMTAAPGIAAYGMTKAALINLTQQLAIELAPRLRVNAVAPAVIETEFSRRLWEDKEDDAASAYPMKRLGTPGDVAGTMAFLLSDDAAWITGQVIRVDGGISLRPPW